MAGRPRRAVWHHLGCDSPLSLRRVEMPTSEPSRCGQVMPGGQPVVCDCGVTGLGKASGRVFSPAQDLRFYSSRLAMRAVRRAYLSETDLSNLPSLPQAREDLAGHFQGELSAIPPRC